MHGFGGGCVVAGGACMVVGGVRGCWGGMHGCGGLRGYRGLGGMHGCGGGMHGCRGACVVAGGTCMVAGEACMGYDEIQSMSGRYASYWNAFLFTGINLPKPLQNAGAVPICSNSHIYTPRIFRVSFKWNAPITNLACHFNELHGCLVEHSFAFQSFCTEECSSGGKLWRPGTQIK